MLRCVVGVLLGLVACSGDGLEFDGTPGAPTPVTLGSWVPRATVSVAGTGTRSLLVDTGAPLTVLDSDSFPALPQGSNEVDLGIIPSCELPPEIEFHPIVTSEGYLIVPLGHALAQHGEHAVQILLKQDVLSQYRLIVPESSAHDRDRLDAFLVAHEISYNGALEVGTIETAKHYVARDLGIAVVSGICLTEADKKYLVAIPIPLKYEAATTYGVILRRKKFRSAALQGLLSTLLND